MASSRPKTIKPGARTKLASKPRSKLGRKPPPPNETRRDRFERIGAKRMQNVLRQIQLLGNLCSPNYECSDVDLVSMRDTIHRELEMALARFTPRKRAATSQAFSFSRQVDGGSTQH